jgi:hypothetical protein
VDWFGENLEGVALSIGRLQDLCRGVMAGDEQDAAPRLQFANSDGGVNAVHSAHDHIADEEIEQLRFGELDGSLSAVTYGGLKAADFEDHCEGIGDSVFIVDDEDPGPGFCVHDC